MLSGHKRLSIGELCEFVNGNGFRPPDWKPSGLPIIRIQNLNGSKSFNYFDGTPKDKWLVEPGDLLFAWAGVKGVSFGPTIWPGPRGVLNQHIYRVTPKKGIDKYWLYLTLQAITHRIEANAHGFKSSLVHVHKEDITSQLVDVPQLSEQRKIAHILQTWEAAIDSYDRLLSAKQARLAALRQRLFAATRPGAIPNPPAAWDETTLGNIFTEVSVLNPGFGAERVITVGKYAIRRQVEHFTRSVASANLSNYQLLNPGDFVYDPMSAYYGAIGRYVGETPGIVSPAYTVIRLADGINPNFIEILLKSHHISFELQNRSSQGNREGKRRTLRSDEFSSVPFMLPPRKEQDRIAGIIGDVAMDLELTERARDALVKQKRGLMQKLLTGEWRVKVEKEAAA
jgi:type I restriction enzyme S subunit